MTWLDDVIAWISPEAGARRKAFREALSEGYSTGYHSRIGSDNAVGGRADYHLDVTGDRREIVERARQLERNNVVAEGLLSRAVDNVVGTGFRLKPLSKSEQFNKRVEELWNEWAEYECDVRGMKTFNDLLALAYRSWLRDGDVGFVMLASGALQAIESDQIANPGGSAIPQNGWVDGVHLDDQGRPTEYNVVMNPDPLWVAVQQQEGTKIPAKWFCYLARHQRLGQTRGISAFSGNAWLLEHIEKSVEATVVAQRMAACVGLYLKRNQRMRGLPTYEDSSGQSRRKINMEPAAIIELQPDEDIGQINPAQPSTNYQEFMSLMGRLVGVPFGLPLELSMMDYSQVNYSSARSSMLGAQRVFKCHQAMLTRFARKIYEWKVGNWIREGKLRNAGDAMKAQWVTPGWAWIDPQKEMEADLAAIDAGLKTRTEVVQARGGVFEENLRILAEEEKVAKSLDLDLARSNKTRDRGESQSPEDSTQSPSSRKRDPQDQDQDDSESSGDEE